LAELRRRLAAAEDALADAGAVMKRAEGAFDAASDRFGAAERALDEAREERAQARRDRYAARQEHARAAAAADRLQRRAAELAGRLDRMAELPGPARRGPDRAAIGRELSGGGQHPSARRANPGTRMEPERDRRSKGGGSVVLLDVATH
jgi:hypothetical protein